MSNQGITKASELKILVHFVVSIFFFSVSKIKAKTKTVNKGVSTMVTATTLLQTIIQNPLLFVVTLEKE